MRPNAKKIVLGMLFARNGGAVEVREMIAAAALFDISANKVRVTLVRMSADGLILASGRGAYRIGPAAEHLAGFVADWQAAEKKLCHWPGDYLAVCTAGLGRSDRKALRRRQQALEISGLREFKPGMYLRPNNLRGGARALRYRLQQLGVAPELLVYMAGEFSADQQQAIAALWNSKALNSGYVETTQRLRGWLRNSASLERDVAAREAWLLGGAAIRQLVHDPWLPEPMVNGELRHDLLVAARCVDEAGKRIWNKLKLTNADTTVDETPSYPSITMGIAPLEAKQ